MVWSEGKSLNGDRYRIIEKVGRGGFGLTYRAIDALAMSDQRDVVIKIPREDLRDQPDYGKYLQSFAKEAATLKHLQQYKNSHIVGIRDQFMEGEIPCLVMDFIDEMNLEETVENMGTLSLWETVRIIRQIGEALTVVHRIGAVHRDVNPSNIMLPKRGHAILIDFGIVGELDSPKLSSFIFGNSDYAAPEQQKGAKTARVDVYALSGCLYFALTGKPPQWADPDKTQVESPSIYNRAIPSDIEAAIMQGLAYVPNQRPVSVEAWLKLLPSVEVLRQAEKQRTKKLKPSMYYETVEYEERGISFRQGLKDYFQLIRKILRTIGRSFIALCKRTIRLIREVIEESKPRPVGSVVEVVSSPKQVKQQLRPDQSVQYAAPRNIKPVTQPKSFTEDLGSGVKLEMVLIPAGSFMMGTPDDEIARLCKEYKVDYFKRESPQHRVTITEPFYMGKFLVTQGQWQAVMGNNPSHFKNGNNYPVDSVSWDNCQEFIKKLNKKTGKIYRLPSEAEWEYACRAGTTTAFYFGETISTDQANYDGNYVYGKGKKGIYREKTTEVGSFPPNSFGLYDMHGNLWEWCEDKWEDNYKKGRNQSPYNDATNTLHVLRGGSWFNTPRSCRSADRLRNYAYYSGYGGGFRLVVSARRG